MLERADQVLALRREGKSFGAIARATGLGRPKAAYDVYRSHLRRLPEDERTEILLEEQRRLDALDALGARLTERGDVDDDERAHRMAALDRLRHELLGVHPKAISERMGHTEIGGTMNVYGHLFEGTQGQLTQDLDDLLERSRAKVSGQPEPDESEGT